MNQNTESIQVMVDAVLARFNKGMAQIDKRFERFQKQSTRAINKVNKSLRSFRMEMLGVMFFGGMMAATFSAMLQPAMDAFGIFDLWSTLLLVTFLPVMEALMPLFLQFFDIMIGLPEPVKLLLGVFAVLGVVIGTLLMVFGQMALGIQALATAFPGIWAGIVSGLKAFVAMFGAGFFLILGVVAAVIAGMVLAWQENFAGMQGFVTNFINAIKSIFSGAFEFIKGLIKVVTAVFTGDWTKAKEGFMMMWNGLLKFCQGIFEALLNGIIAVGIGVLKIIFNVVKFMWDAGVELVTNLAKGITSVAGMIKDAILGLFPKWARDMIWNTGKMIIKIFTSGGGGDNGDGGSNEKKKDDFIWRPGSGAVSINPNDTIVGFKGDAPASFSGGKGDVVINQTINISGGMSTDIQRMFAENNKKLVDDIKRLTAARA